MSKMIDRLVELRSKLPLNWNVPIEDEAIWWANALAEELIDMDTRNEVDGRRCGTSIGFWIRGEVND